MKSCYFYSSNVLIQRRNVRLIGDFKSVCVFVCVCVCAREREREREMTSKMMRKLFNWTLSDIFNEKNLISGEILQRRLRQAFTRSMLFLMCIITFFKYPNQWNLSNAKNYNYCICLNYNCGTKMSKEKKYSKWQQLSLLVLEKE